MFFQGWTLRVRAASRAPAPLLLMIHGWTGDENSMWVFTRGLSPDYWIVAPRAPFAAQPAGYSWRPAQPGGHAWPTFEDLQPGVQKLLSLADAYAAENELDAGQLDLMGFSQGAALVTALALVHPQRVRRAAVLAGFVPQGADALSDARPLKGKPFFVAHGTQDERVPIQHAHAAVKVLEAAGAHVTYCEDNVAHKLGLRCLREMESFFA